MISFERLIEEHREVAARAARLKHAIMKQEDANAIRRAIEALDAVLAAHLHCEDHDIYPLLLASRDEGDRMAAHAAIIHWSSLAADWADFARHWTSGAIDDDRQALNAAFSALVARLSGRVQSENEVLYPMALRGAHIRLRAA